MNAPRFTDSPEQAKVVNAPTGDDVLVVAGAGSGKTYTMTRRIINLIAQGVPAERILGLTFTRKAASELLSRVSAAVLADGGDERFANRAFLKPEVSTYDAFFQTIVRQYGLLVGFDQNTQPLSQAGAIQLATTVVGRHMDILFEQDLGAFKTVVNGGTGVVACHRQRHDRWQHNNDGRGHRPCAGLGPGIPRATRYRHWRYAGS